MSTEVTCVICGKKKMHPPSRAAGRKTCGMDCLVEYRKRNGNSGIEADRGVAFINAMQGPCPTCAAMFRSKHKKKYCSMKCHTSSSEFQIRIRAQAESINSTKRVAAGISNGERLSLLCLQCGEQFFVRTADRNNRWCTRSCWRKYLSDRFDRWVANPQEIALPQCFDEFLSQTEIPCLVDGCNWVGLSLGHHVNFAHGIGAAEFKERAGFNRNTGLIGSELAKYLSIAGQGRMAQRMTDGFIPSGYKGKPGIAPTSPSLEAREHAAKARALKLASYVPDPEKCIKCRMCGTPVMQPAMGWKNYCNKKCRSQWLGRKQHELTCDQCGMAFLGSQNQKRRAGRGEPVCCSLDCRSKRNVGIAIQCRRDAIAANKEAAK